MAKTEILTSPANPLLKEVRRAIVRGALTRDGCAVAEGFHLLEEALRSDRQIQMVLAAESVRSAVEGHVRRLPGLRVATLADALFESICGTESSQGVIALVRPPRWSLEQLFRGRALVVVLDGVQDPGNAGAIVRAAEAFGATGVMFLKGAANPYNPKSLRASAGSLFRVPLAAGLDDTLALAALEQQRLDLYSAVPAGKRNLGDVDLTRKCALIIGSEGRGVREKLRAGAVDLRIPTTGVESLNAAMAAGILLYEARRQRMLKESL
ncbi:MAG: RNA methyltransferase [Acidobacteriota bacterium]